MNTKKIAMFLLGATLSAPLFAQTGPAVGATILWADEFDGSTLDATKWCVEAGEGVWNTGGNQELQMYTAANVAVTGGSLAITAKKEVSGKYQFTSGKIATGYKVTAKKGWIVARIQIPNLKNGLWPAFWMMGATKEAWPLCGEIDIMEMGHKDAINNAAGNLVNSYSTGALHWEVAGKTADYFTGAYVTSLATPTDLSLDYHEYKLHWTDAIIETYIDGTKTFVMNIGTTPAFVNNAFYSILNLAVGGSITGITTPAGVTATFPATMLVDYIRVYDDNGKGAVTVNAASDCKTSFPLVKPSAINFGIWSESKKQKCTQNIVMGMDAQLYIWNNGETFSTAAAYNPSFEGTTNLVINPGTIGWYGGAITCVGTPAYKDMTNYKDGYMHFALNIPAKTTGTFKIFINAGGTQYSYNFLAPTYRGITNDGLWHEVYVKLSEFGAGIDFSNVTQFFGVGSVDKAGGGVYPYTAGQTYAFDDIYWTLTNTPTGIETIKSEKKAGFTISPNPTSTGVVNIQGTEAFGNEIVTISVIDIAGKVAITTQAENSSKIELSTASLVPGIYIISVSAGNTIQQQKLMVR